MVGRHAHASGQGRPKPHLRDPVESLNIDVA